MAYEPEMQKLNRDTMTRVTSNGYLQADSKEYITMNRLDGQIRKRDKGDATGGGGVRIRTALKGKVKIKES